MNRDELIKRAETGRRIAALVGDEAVQSVYTDTVEQLRASMRYLEPQQQMEWTIGQASVQALERFWAGLNGLVEVGADAEMELAGDEVAEVDDTRHRGIL